MHWFPSVFKRLALDAQAASLSTAFAARRSGIVSNFLRDMHKYTHQVACVTLLPFRTDYDSADSGSERMWILAVGILMQNPHRGLRIQFDSDESFNGLDSAEPGQDLD